MTVGKSKVTPFKHLLINSVIGREAGVFSLDMPSIDWLKPPYFFIDANAGDGADEMATPKTLIKHAETIRKKRGHDAAKVYLIEKRPETFEKLLGNVDKDHADFICGDSCDIIPKLISGPAYRPGFIVIDPNTIAGLPDLASIVSSMNKYTSMLVTMGSNAGGIKRRKREHREKGYSQVEAVANAINHSSHRLLLIRMLRGRGCWAYMVTYPAKWDARVRKDIAASAKKATALANKEQEDLFGAGTIAREYEYECAAFGERRFNEILDILFLTEKEREAG